MSFVKILCIAGSIFAATHCGNTGIYDEATTNYVRIVRSGLNEWYPLNGNLSSKIGSAAGTATGSYSAGANRAGESGKAVCLTASPVVEIDFNSTTFGTTAVTIGIWVKMNVLPAALSSIIEKGNPITSMQGYRIRVDPGVGFPNDFGDGGSNEGNLSISSTAANTWYYFVFTFENGNGSYYVGKYGQDLKKIGVAPAVYTPNANPVKVFSGNIDGCVDDIVHYNRALSFDEVKQNFLSVE